MHITSAIALAIEYLTYYCEAVKSGNKDEARKYYEEHTAYINAVVANYTQAVTVGAQVDVFSDAVGCVFWEGAAVVKEIVEADHGVRGDLALCKVRFLKNNINETTYLRAVRVG